MPTISRLLLLTAHCAAAVGRTQVLRSGKLLWLRLSLEGRLGVAEPLMSLRKYWLKGLGNGATQFNEFLICPDFANWFSPLFKIHGK